MPLSELSWKLILLFTPGIICTLTIDMLTIHARWSPFDFLIRSFIYGIITYLFLQLLLFTYFGIYSVYHHEQITIAYLSIWRLITEQGQTVNIIEITGSSILSIIVGFIASKVMNDKVLIKIGRKLKITSKFGDDDVWSYFLSDDEVHWVWVRCPKDNIVYEGWVQAFSESEKYREIVLRDVKVYANNNSSFLYEIPAAYLSGEPNDLFIEIPPDPFL
ncbi:MAG: DUF6338 family protein [bacterium]